MKRQVHKLITPILPLLAFVLVGACSEVDKEAELIKETKSVIAAAEQGDRESQYKLGEMYDEGDGVPQDLKESVKWFRKSAEQGFAAAQLAMSLSYYLGYGVPQDYEESVKWSRKAAEQGYARAQRDMGEFYENGYGVPQDDVKAYAWYNVSSANGDEGSSMFRDNIAVLMTPEQIAEGQKLSREWFEKYQPKE